MRMGRAAYSSDRKDEVEDVQHEKNAGDEYRSTSNLRLVDAGRTYTKYMVPVCNANHFVSHCIIRNDAGRRETYHREGEYLKAIVAWTVGSSSSHPDCSTLSR